MEKSEPLKLPDETPLTPAAYVLTERSYIIMPGNIKHYLQQLWGMDYPFEFEELRYDFRDIRARVGAHIFSKLYKVFRIPWLLDKSVQSVIGKAQRSGEDRRYAIRVRGITVYVETRDHPLRIDYSPDLGRRQVFPQWQDAASKHTSHIAVLADPALPRETDKESRGHVGVSAILAAVAAAVAHCAWLASAQDPKDRKQAPVLWGPSGIIMLPEHLVGDLRKHILPMFLIFRSRWFEQVDRDSKASPEAFSQGLFLFIGHEVYLPALPYPPDQVLHFFVQILLLLAFKPYMPGQILEVVAKLQNGQKVTFSAKTNLQPERINSREVFRLEVSVTPEPAQV